MAIKIIRVGQPSSEVKTSEPVATKAEERDVAAWRQDIPALGAKQIKCEYCGRYYLKPCIEGVHQKCQNFLHLHGKAKVLGAP